MWQTCDDTETRYELLGKGQTEAIIETQRRRIGGIRQAISSFRRLRPDRLTNQGTRQGKHHPVCFHDLVMSFCHHQVDKLISFYSIYQTSQSSPSNAVRHNVHLFLTNISHKLPPGTSLVPDFLISSFLCCISSISLTCSAIFPSLACFSASAAASQTICHQHQSTFRVPLLVFYPWWLERNWRTWSVRFRIFLQLAHEILEILLFPYSVL